MFYSHNFRSFVIQACLLIVVCFRVHMAMQLLPCEKYSENQIVEGVLINYPKVKKRFQYLDLNNCKILTLRFPHYKVGEHIKVSDIDTNSSDFLLWPKIEVLSDKSDLFLSFIANIRDKIINRANLLLPPPYSNLLLGIIFGIDQGISDSLYKVLYNGGILHVVVASGYNVSVLLLFIFYFLKYLNKYLHLVVSVLLVTLYLFISGINPPLVRASIMGICFLSARLSGVYFNPFVVLFFTVNLMLIFNPFYVMESSFWMSVVAMVGLLSVAVLFKTDNNLNELSIYSSFKESLIVNLFLFPITAYFFGTINIGGLVANPLVLWMVPFIMFFGILYLLSGWHVLGTLIIGLLDLFIGIVGLVGNSIKNIEINLNSVFYIIPLYIGVFIAILLIGNDDK